MRVAGGKDIRIPRVCVAGVQRRQVHHSPDALTGALRGVQRSAGAEQPCGIPLAFPYDAVRHIQFVRAGDLGDVQSLTAKQFAPLVPRHMQTDGIARGVVPDEISDRRVHSSGVIRCLGCSAFPILLLGNLHHDGALNTLAEQFAPRLIYAADGAGCMVGIGGTATGAV